MKICQLLNVCKFAGMNIKIKPYTQQGKECLNFTKLNKMINPLLTNVSLFMKF